MNEITEQALANFRHEQALSIAHGKRAEKYLAHFLSSFGEPPSGDRVATGQAVRCVREWTRWLSENGPAHKSTIVEATGVKFTERGMTQTFMWDDAMVNDADDALPADALMRIQGPPKNTAGRPPMVYFLWSQRYEVYPLFGVGPLRPDPAAQSNEPQAMTGVIMPISPVIESGRYETVPTSSHPIDPAYGEELTLSTVVDSLMERPMNHTPFYNECEPDLGASERDMALDQPERYATLAEWDAAWEPFMDRLVANDAKPTDGEKEELIATLPEEAEPNAALAIAHRNAVLRSREQ